jgi:hypothetical protein
VTSEDVYQNVIIDVQQQLIKEYGIEDQQLPLTIGGMATPIEEPEFRTLPEHVVQDLRNKVPDGDSADILHTRIVDHPWVLDNFNLHRPILSYLKMKANTPYLLHLDMPMRASAITYATDPDYPLDLCYEVSIPQWDIYGEHLGIIPLKNLRSYENTITINSSTAHICNFMLPHGVKTMREDKGCEVVLLYEPWLSFTDMLKKYFSGELLK